MKKIILPFIILAVIQSGVLFAEEQTSPKAQLDSFIESHGDLPIQKVEIRGLSKTRKSVVLSRLPVEMGSLLSSFDPDEAVQELRKLNLFHKIEIGYEPNGSGVDIITLLSEKMTLIPLPVVLFAGKYQSYGLFLLDMNFLGLGKKFFGGGSYSPQAGWKTQVGYVDPEVLSTRFVFSTSFMVGDELFENRLPGGDIFQRFQAFHFLTELTFGYKIYKNHTLSSLSRYRLGNTGSTEDALLEPASVQVFYQGIRYQYRNQYFKKVLTFGWAVVADFTRGIPVSGDVSGHNQSRLVASYSFPLFSSHRVTLLARGGAGKLPAAFEERIGGTGGFKTLPRNDIAADHYISGTVTYEYPFWHHRLVTVTAAVSWEQGAYRKDEMSMENSFGPGAGLRLYLKKIAIPAVGLDFVYNIAQKEYLFAAAVGAAL